jgi:hypothetical protein
MKKMFALIGILMVALTIIMPAAVSAANSYDVFAPKSNQPVSEDDVLRYAATEWQNGYINETFTMTQATMQDRMDYLRQQAVTGYDPNSSDPYIYSLLLPNSATLAQVNMWFGHPVVMADGKYLIKDWFGYGNDAVVNVGIEQDIRTDSGNILAY